jgi:hypothetical protein
VKMAMILTQDPQLDEWSRGDFPHHVWSQAIVEVNGEIVTPLLVEFGASSKTGQSCLVVTFEDGSKLNIWLDPDYPKRHLRDYAVWKNCAAFYGLTLSTCPEWREHRCSRCQVKVELWTPPDQVIVDLKFCERDDHKRLHETPHAHIIIRNIGFTQKRLGMEA